MNYAETLTAAYKWACILLIVFVGLCVAIG